MQQREHGGTDARRGDRAEQPEQQPDARADRELGGHEPVAARVGQQGRCEGLVPVLRGDEEGADDHREHVAEGDAHRVDGADDLVGGDDHRLVRRPRGGLALREGPAEHAGEEGHVGDHDEQQQPPHARGDDLAVLGDEGRAHQFTPPWDVGTAEPAGPGGVAEPGGAASPGRTVGAGAAGPE